MNLTIYFIFSLLPHLGLTIICYRCQTGYVTPEVCSNQITGGNYNECLGENSQCYESIQWFNNGALRLVIRDCWTPPVNTTRNYCDSYQNFEGVLKYCKTCTENFCNSDPIFFPEKIC